MKSKYAELWFRGLSDQNKKDLDRELALGLVSQKIEEVIDQLVREASSVKRADYSNPGWAYEQAHRNGEIAAYKKILSLFRPTQDQRS